MVRDAKVRGVSRRATLALPDAVRRMNSQPLEGVRRQRRSENDAPEQSRLRGIASMF